MENTEFKNLSRAQDYLEEKFETKTTKFDLDSDNGVVEDSVDVTEIGDKIIISCLKYDESPRDYFEDDEGAGEFFEFRNVESRDAKAVGLKKDKKLFYLVDKYAHGSVHYSISQTHSYPDQRWDVAHGCAIFIPCDYIQQEYRKAAKKSSESEAAAQYVADSNSILDNYSDWCNGEVYGYSVKVFDKSGKELEIDECWGFIGREYAETEKKSIVEHYVNKATVEAEVEEPKKTKKETKKNPAQMDLFENNDHVVANSKKKKM